MKTLKIAIGALFMTSILFLSCAKEKNQSAEKAEDTITFIPGTDKDKVQTDLELDQLLNGHLETVKVIKEPSGLTCEECCVMDSLKKVVAPWDPTLINLNVKYHVSDPNQVVQIKHWVNSGAGYVYFGQDNITTSYDCCTAKSVNMGTNHIPSGTILSWARIYDGTTGGYCGGDVLHTWTK